MKWSLTDCCLSEDELRFEYRVMDRGVDCFAAVPSIG